MRERDEVGEVVERERGHRADFVAGERTTFFEQGAGGGGQGHPAGLLGRVVGIDVVRASVEARVRPVGRTALVAIGSMEW